MINKIKSINFDFVISCVVSWSLLLMFVTKGIGGNNMTYAIGEMREYNPELFIGNIIVGAGGVSPKYVVEKIIGFLMFLNNGNWGNAAILFVYFGVIIQAIGIANISRRIDKKHQIIVSAIFTCLILYCGNYLAGFSLFELNSIGMGIGIAFSIFSISFLVGDKRNYKVAWIVATCAVFFHIHEGLYCCAVILFFALVDSIVQKKILLKENVTIICAIIAGGIMAGPNILTDNLRISDSDFVYIYSVFRHPHHLVPSSWGIDLIIKTIVIDICLFLLCLAAKKMIASSKIKFYLYEAIMLVVAWIVAFFTMYIFTEIMPVATISTLFISKSFKYVLLVALIWIVRAALELREQGDYISSYLLVFFAFFASAFEFYQICIIFLIILVIMKLEEHFISDKKIFISCRVITFIDIAFFVLLICIKRKTLDLEMGTILNLLLSFKETMKLAFGSGMSTGIVIILVFFLVAVIEFCAKKKFRGYKTLCIFACICMLVISAAGKIIIKNEGESFGLINGELALQTSMGAETYGLAKAFKNLTNQNTVYLGDPDDADHTGWFQVVSERNCYVVRKSIPISKATVGEWYDRYIQTTSFNDKSSDEIAQIMLSAGIEYVLVDEDNFEKLDESSLFSLYLNSSADSFRIYKFNLEND